MRNLDLEQLINSELNTAAFQDYGPNGLQVEGRSHVQRIVTGVTACQALLDAAVVHQADDCGASRLFLEKRSAIGTRHEAQPTENTAEQ